MKGAEGSGLHQSPLVHLVETLWGLSKGAATSQSADSLHDPAQRDAQKGWFAQVLKAASRVVVGGSRGHVHQEAIEAETSGLPLAQPLLRTWEGP